MSWSDSVVTVTSWTTTIFFYVALLILTPWIIALLYDILLYTWRSLTHDIPLIGGRARGQRSPPSSHTPPTLTEHTDGAGRRTPPVELAEKVVERAGEVVAGAVREVRTPHYDGGLGTGSGQHSPSAAGRGGASAATGYDDQDGEQQRTLRRKTGQVSRSPG